MYHGPVGEVEAFFRGMGFHCPERKGVADFLQEVTSRKDQEVRDLLFLRIPPFGLRCSTQHAARPAGHANANAQSAPCQQLRLQRLRIASPRPQWCTRRICQGCR